MKLPQIVGISGTNGAGKDELGKLLAERRGYHFHSVTEVLRDELGRQGKAITRENQAALSKQWRNESGDGGIMFKKAIDAYLAEKDENGYEGVALVSLRHPDENKTIHSYGGVVVWVDADQRVRYERVRAANRNRHEEDNVSFEQFQADEEREMHPPADAPQGALHMAAVKELADITIENDFPSVEAYREFLIKEFEL